MRRGCHVKVNQDLHSFKSGCTTIEALGESLPTLISQAFTIMLAVHDSTVRFWLHTEIYHLALLLPKKYTGV